MGLGTRDLVVEILDSLAKWETTLHAEPTSVAHMAERHFLPFINLFSWAKSDDRDQAAAAGHVREYLQAAKPLVALTFGQKVVQHCSWSFSLRERHSGTATHG